VGEKIETKYEIIDYRKDPDDGRVLVQVDWLENKKGRAFMDITEWVNKAIDQAEQRGRKEVLKLWKKAMQGNEEVYTVDDYERIMRMEYKDASSSK